MQPYFQCGCQAGLIISMPLLALVNNCGKLFIEYINIKIIIVSLLLCISSLFAEAQITIHCDSKMMILSLGLKISKHRYQGYFRFFHGTRVVFLNLLHSETTQLAPENDKLVHRGQGLYRFFKFICTVNR